MKDNESEHVVQRVKFEFEIPQERDAQRLYTDLTRIFNNEVSRLLEKLLDEYDDPQYKLRIDSIVLDLGEISEGTLDQRVPRLLEDRLRTALWDIIGSPGTKTIIPSNNLEVVPILPSKLELLEEFLQTGRLPVRASRLNRSIHEIVRELLEDHPEKVVETIRSAAKLSRTVIRRVAIQFQPSTLQALYRVFQPAYGAYLIEQERMISEGVKKAMKVDTKLVLEEVRIAFLMHLVQHRSGSFSTREFRRAVGKQLQISLGPRVEAVFSKEELTGDQASGQDTEALLKDEAAGFALVQTFLLTGNLTVDRDVFLQVWGHLNLHAPVALAQVIAHSKAKPAVIAKLLAMLPEPAVMELFYRAIPTQGAQLMEIAAAVISLVAAYLPKPAANPSFLRKVYAALVHYSMPLAESPSQIAAAGAVQAIAKELKRETWLPEVLKTALEQQVVPGIRGLKPITETPASPTEKTADQTQVWEEHVAQTPDAETQIPWDGTSNSQDKEREAEEAALQRVDAEYQKEQAELAARVEAEAQAKAEAENLAKIKAEEEAQLAAIKSEQDSESSPEVKTPEVGSGDEPVAETTTEKTGEEEPPVKRPPERPESPQQKELRARAEAKAKAEAEEKAAAVAQEASEVEESRQRDTQRGAVGGMLDTVVARLDFIEHFLVHGNFPWWLETRDAAALEQSFSTLLKIKPQELENRLREVILRLPPAQVKEVVQRLVTRVGPALILAVLNRLLPDIGGFIPLLTHVLQRYYEDPPRSLNYPAELGSKPNFVWHYVTQFVFEYLSSNPGAAAMLKYVVHSTGVALGDSPRIFMREVTAIVDSLIAKGETKYVALKSMLPRPDQELYVEPPVPHPQAEGTELSPEIRAMLQVADAVEAVREGVDSFSAEEGEASGLTETALEAARQRRDLRRKTEKEGREGDQPQAETRPEGGIGEEPSEGKTSESLDSKKIQTHEDALDTSAEYANKPAGKLPVREDGNVEQGLTPEGEIQDVKPNDMPPQEEKDQEQEDLYKGLPEEDIYSLGEAPPSVRGPQAETGLPPSPPSLPELPDGPAKALLLYLAEPAAIMEFIKHYFTHGSLRGGMPFTVSQAQFVVFFNYARQAYREEFQVLVKQLVTQRTARKRLLAIGEDVVAEIMQSIAPSSTPFIRPYLNILLGFADTISAPLRREDLLDHAFAYVARLNTPLFSPLDYVRSLVGYAEAELKVEPKKLITWLFTKVEESRAPQQSTFLQVLNVLRAAPLPEAKKPEQKPPRELRKKPEPEEVYVTNAGMVLVHPFFPQLFNMFKFLTPDRTAFINEEAQGRAVHLLQYVTTKETDASEELLTLNKLIVGLPLDAVVPSSAEFTDEEKEIVEGMLQAACTRFAAMKRASPDSLRAQFLNREGKLKKKKDGWDLIVTQKAYDVLLAKLPWGLNPVRLPWITMKFEIYWR